MADTYEELKAEIESMARFEALVHFPAKRDPEWPKWSARASIEGLQTPAGIMGTGETDIEALQALVRELRRIRQAGA